MNLLSLKAVVFDVGDKGFHSPTRRDFVWPKGVVARACNRKCETDTINPDCTCGLYSSPNPDALVEYAEYPNTVFVLLNNYGWSDVWTGPHDLPGTYVLRSWGAQIIGIVGSVNEDSALHLAPQRYQSALLGIEFYEVTLYPWNIAKEMIRHTWKTFLNIDPYRYEELMANAGNIFKDFVEKYK